MRPFLIAALLSLSAGCHRPPTENVSKAASASPIGPTVVESSSGVAKAPVDPSAGSDLAAAVATVRLYYERLGAKDYPGAYRLWWGEGAASGYSGDAFAKGFAGTADTNVTIRGRGDVKGAAGSSYATIPVTVDARLVSGEAQHFAGSYVLRRVNDVPGSRAAERRWRLHTASLKQTARDTKKGRG